MPQRDTVADLLDAKRTSKRQIGSLLADWVPSRLAHAWLDTHRVAADARLADLPDKTLRQIGDALSGWTLTPNGTEGYKKAEVTKGGSIRATCRRRR